MKLFPVFAILAVFTLGLTLALACAPPRPPCPKPAPPVERLEPLAQVLCEARQPWEDCFRRMRAVSSAAKAADPEPPQEPPPSPWTPEAIAAFFASALSAIGSFFAVLLPLL